MQVLLLCSLSAAVASQDVTQQAKSFLADFGSRAEEISYESSLASWNYNTNITEETARAMVSAMPELPPGSCPCPACAASAWAAAESCPWAAVPALAVACCCLAGYPWASTALHSLRPGPGLPSHHARVGTGQSLPGVTLGTGGDWREKARQKEKSLRT